MLRAAERGRRVSFADMLETIPGRYERRKRRKERRRGLIILLVFIIFVGGLAAGAGIFYTWATGASGPQNKVPVTIQHGASGECLSYGVAVCPLKSNLITKSVNVEWHWNFLPSLLPEFQKELKGWGHGLSGASSKKESGTSTVAAAVSIPAAVISGATAVNRRP